MEKVAAAEEAAVVANHERAGVVARTDEAKAHTEEAKNRGREAEVKTREAEARAETAEVTAREAEIRAETDIADYKASADFVQEVVEASLRAYTKGFDFCKAKVSAAFNISGPELDEIQAGDIGNEEAAAEEEEEETEEKSGLNEP